MECRHRFPDLFEILQVVIIFRLVDNNLREESKMRVLVIGSTKNNVGLALTMSKIDKVSYPTWPYGPAALETASKILEYDAANWAKV